MSVCQCVACWKPDPLPHAAAQGMGLVSEWCIVEWCVITQALKSAEKKAKQTLKEASKVAKILKARKVHW